MRALDLSSARNVRFVGFGNQNTEEVIINVMRETNDSSTSLIFSNMGISLGALPARSLLWNICGGTDSILIQSASLPGALPFVDSASRGFQNAHAAARPVGALLAAAADVTLQNGQVRGQAVARTMRSTGGGQIVNPPC